MEDQTPLRKYRQFIVSSYIGKVIGIAKMLHHELPAPLITAIADLDILTSYSTHPLTLAQLKEMDFTKAYDSFKLCYEDQCQEAEANAIVAAATAILNQTGGEG